MRKERWLVTGASGQLGGHVVRQLVRANAGASVLALVGLQGAAPDAVNVRRVDLTDFDAVRAVLAAFAPTHIVHTAAMSAVGACHAQPADAERINAEATGVLAAAAQACGARLVYTSTDMVFAGDAAPYREGDAPGSLSCYGRTKLAAERLLADCPRAVIVRLPLMYGFPCIARTTTFVQQMAAVRTGEPLRLFTDEFRTPVWLADAARALIGVARSDFVGLIHVAGPERLSRYELVARCAQVLGLRTPNLIATSRLDVAAPEPRPADLSLDGTRFAELFPELRPGPIRIEALQPA